VWSFFFMAARIRGSNHLNATSLVTRY